MPGDSGFSLDDHLGRISSRSTRVATRPRRFDQRASVSTVLDPTAARRRVVAARRGFPVVAGPRLEHRGEGRARPTNGANESRSTSMIADRIGFIWRDNPQIYWSTNKATRRLEPKGATSCQFACVLPGGMLVATIARTLRARRRFSRLSSSVGSNCQKPSVSSTCATMRAPAARTSYDSNPRPISDRGATTAKRSPF